MPVFHTSRDPAVWQGRVQPPEGAVGYYMRYFDPDPRPLRVTQVRAGLRRFDPTYGVEPNGRGCGLLTAAGDPDPYGELEINGDRSKLFHGERDEMLVGLVGNRGKQRKRVEEVLRAAQRVVSVRVLHGTRDSETTFELLDCLWDWLNDTRPGGLLYADREGYYEDEVLILKVK